MNELAWMMRFSQYTEIHDEDARDHPNFINLQITKRYG
jgi:hypothetical protein